jgi:ribosome-associated protein
MICVTNTIHLSDKEIEERFIRASGPGGQNVNKIETAVQIRFDARHSPAISNAIFLRLRSVAGRRMTRDGVIVLTSSRFRSQKANRIDAQERLVALIRTASESFKLRRLTKPTLGSNSRRLAIKRMRGAIKKIRNLSELDE